MKKSSWVVVSTLTLGGIAGAAWWALRLNPEGTYTIERSDYSPPVEPDDGLADDKLADKAPEFNPGLTDPRPAGDWSLNLSAAVVGLNVPMIRADVEPKLLELHPTYLAAVADGGPVLPSVNLIDGKAKQFDDGLVAAIEMACFRGLDGVIESQVGMIEKLLAQVGVESPAAPFLAAGLELAGKPVTVKASQEKARWLASFLADETRSKPVGFHAWTPELGRSFRFSRFFQTSFAPNELTIPRELARGMAGDPSLLEAIRRVWAFSGQLSNPATTRSVVDLIEPGGRLAADDRVSLLPVASSRELELFGRIFPRGLPADANLIRELVSRVRSRSVDLRPRDDGGWLDHQVYALETLLVPDRGDERDRLLLTKTYKRRMLDAFQALITKRLETHSPDVKSVAAGPGPLEPISPRLRLEPCPSFYLRTARSYTFLDEVLRATVGEARMKQIHGLREGGERAADLWTELGTMRELFYGFYLISAEDLGLEPACLDTDGIDAEKARVVAAHWLEDYRVDPDLSVDTRVSVPIYVDRGRKVTRLWATLGVRLAKLDASYARPPRARPTQGPGDWREVEPYLLETSHYLIAVDEVAEVELKGERVLTRPELRKVCDQARTKEAIVRAMAR